MADGLCHHRGMARLTEQQRQQFTASYPDWRLDGDSIVRTFRFTDFVEAMGFVTRVALLAEKAFHHPDLEVRFNRVTVRLTTHDEGGLSEKDIQLAERIEALLS